MQNHLWCPNDPRGYGIDDDDDDDLVVVVEVIPFIVLCPYIVLCNNPKENFLFCLYRQSAARGSMAKEFLSRVPKNTNWQRHRPMDGFKDFVPSSKGSKHIDFTASEKILTLPNTEHIPTEIYL